MTPEEIRKETLRLHTLLQMFYKERMGEYRQGDRMNYTYYPSQPHIFFVDAVDEKQRHINMDACIRLPLPIDPVNPERGLWGMIDWSDFRIAGYDFYATMELHSGNDWSSGRTTPELALLRALAKQVGVE